MANLQGGLLLTQVRRDPEQLRVALAAARTVLRGARAIVVVADHEFETPEYAGVVGVLVAFGLSQAGRWPTGGYEHGPATGAVLPVRPG
jgi:hypothetical protein